jgi:prevent-host-death family protein
MLIYNIHDAKSQLSKLIEAVQHGEEVVIAKAGKPVAVLGPVNSVPPKRVRGVLKGQINLGPEFDEPLPPDLLESLGG